MAPALSDEENDVSSGEEKIPYRGKSAPADTVHSDNDEDEEEEEGAEDEYVVEKIVGHKIQKGVILYDVKWQGYDNPKDRTWEPEVNLDGAADVLHEYWDEIGGRPDIGKGKKRKPRKSGAEEPETGTPASTSKRLKKEKEWSPPPGSWEQEVDLIDTVIQNEDSKTGQQERFALLTWTNGKKTQHPLRQVYQKCPQKMLQYYEGHLVFTPGDETNGDEPKKEDLVY